MAEPLRTLIVDDEPAAIRRLVRLCEPIAAVTVVATATDGNEAFAVLDRESVDLLLLDIEMPSLSGLALAERLVGRRPQPAIVFVTAFEQFAIAAFAVDAVGYLLKPVDPELLRDTIHRVTRRGVPPLAIDPGESGFWVPSRGSLIRILCRDIDHIDAEDDYVRLHCGARSHLVSERLYAIEQRFGADRFLRIHRSCLVNRDRITEIVIADGRWAVVLASGGQLPIGRSCLTAVRTTLGLR